MNHLIYLTTVTTTNVNGPTTVQRHLMTSLHTSLLNGCLAALCHLHWKVLPDPV